VNLFPKVPPGRSSRKALAFESEIGRLHFEGYSSEAIRRTLQEAGVTVSLSAVKREVARHAHPTQPLRATPEAARVKSDVPGLAVLGSAHTAPLPRDPRSSKEIAADFVKSRITNPLLRARGA
jgi:hypothetical protein